MPLPSLTTRMFYGTYEFVAAPLFTWSAELVKDSTDESLFLRRGLDLQGVLLELAGESGNFPGLLQQRQLLDDAVTTSGQEFKILHEGVTLVSGIFPSLESFTFDAGTWTDRIDYGVTFTYNEQIEDKPAVEQFSETWTFEEQEDRTTIRTSHDVSAVGVNTAVSGQNNSLQNARTFVLDRSGSDRIPTGHPAFAQASGSLAFEELRTENVDIQEGSFGITETFIIGSGNFIHTQNANFSTDENGITTVSLDGTVQGLGRSVQGFDNALTAWDNNIKPRLDEDAEVIYSRFVGSGTLFTSNPRTLSITQVPFAAQINYSYSYDDDVASDLPEEIQDASIQIQNQEPLVQRAVFQIPDRTQGPIYQDINTTTEGQYTITGNATGKQGVDISVVKAYVQEQINLNLPDTKLSNFVDLRLSQKNVSTDEIKNTVNFTVTWNYTMNKGLVDDGTVITIT
jgi:hypothetical protein